jgi:hypothetical protein
MLIGKRLLRLLSPEKHCHFPAIDTLVVRWPVLTWKKTKIENVTQHTYTINYQQYFDEIVQEIKCQK